MTPQIHMTQQQIKWAQSHDWFHSDNGNGTILVVDRYVTRDGVSHEEVKLFGGDYRALRNWAGY